MLKRLTLNLRHCIYTKPFLFRAFSSEISQYSQETLKKNKWIVPEDYSKSEVSHRSNAEQLIHRIPVLEIDAPVVRCLGSAHVGYGHPQVYIKLDTTNPHKPNVCKYCGLQYVMKKKSH